MLFILVMDVLCHLVHKASEEELLQPLARRVLQHRISLYADDVVIFLLPSASDINITLDILQLFGEASGLKTNIQKSSVHPIQCLEEDKTILHNHLHVRFLISPASTWASLFPPQIDIGSGSTFS